MKAGKVVLAVLIIIVFVLFGLAYALLYQQEQVTAQRVEAFSDRLSGINSSLQNLEAQLKSLDIQSKGYNENIRNIENKIELGSVGKAELSSKIADIIKDIEELKKSLSANISAKEEIIQLPVSEVKDAPQEVKGDVLQEPVAQVELGEIPVKK